MFSIGTYHFEGSCILAPMAGVTDRPFRQLCRKLGADLAVSEMLTADSSLWNSNKSKWRMDHQGEPGPISVQIAGGDAQMLAQAAILNQNNGAQLIDINMGCPAKKVCNKAAGSALMRDEPLVEEILNAVVAAVDIPVTLKIRTGWDQQTKNALTIAKMAENAGIQALAVHGRTRVQKYTGEAEYNTISEIKQAINIPVFANGDITCPQKAREVLEQTGADAVMIGRGAQGNPWIFREINHYLSTGKLLDAPSIDEKEQVLIEHLNELYNFYGDYMGIRIARKHVGWYLNDINFRKQFNAVTEMEQQKDLVFRHFQTARELAA